MGPLDQGCKDFNVVLFHTDGLKINHPVFRRKKPQDHLFTMDIGEHRNPDINRLIVTGICKGPILGGPLFRYIQV